MPLTTTIKFGLQAVLTKVLDFHSAQDPLNVEDKLPWATGTGANQADQSFHDKRPLTTGSSEELDVAGVLKDAFGDTVTLARVKVLYIKNTSTADTLLIGGAASNALGLFSDPGDILKLPPGGILMLTAPDATGIAVGSNDKLKLAHSGDSSANLTYEIAIIGASA